MVIRVPISLLVLKTSYVTHIYPPGGLEWL